MKKYILNDIPEDLHRRLKMMAARKGTSMKEIILEAIHEKLEKEYEELPTDNTDDH